MTPIALIDGFGMARSPGTCSGSTDGLYTRGFVESLDDLTERQLVLAVDMTRAGLRRWQGRDLYELHGYGHPHIHGGGIAVLKGLQVGIGWVESEAFRSAANVEDVDE